MRSIKRKSFSLFVKLAFYFFGRKPWEVIVQLESGESPIVLDRLSLTDVSRKRLIFKGDRAKARLPE